jgi:polyisoprenoid-binding protein YceI
MLNDWRRHAIVALVWLALSSAAPAGTTYALGPANTHVSFTVQRLGIQWIAAHFEDISGRFALDPQGQSGHVSVSVGMASIHCSDPRWNQRLRSAEWLDVERYPRMSFESESLELGEGRGSARGPLTLHGFTHPVLLEVDFLHCVSGGLCQFSAHGRLRRSDYGLPHGFWSGGDLVEIAISGTLAQGSIID